MADRTPNLKDRNDMKEARDMVEPAGKREMDTARNMPDAANAENTLQGYAAINDVDQHEEIAQLAYQYYLDRGGEEGYADDDWFRAEEEVSRRRWPFAGEPK